MQRISRTVPVLLALVGLAASTLSPPLTPAAESAWQTGDFLDQVAEDTWNYLQWAQDSHRHHLPWSWRSDHVSLAGQGDYANPTEIGLYMLATLAAYDMARPWSPTLREAEIAIIAALNQLESWQSSTQNAYNRSVFYQWYHINNQPPTAGTPNSVDRVVPSTDNAFLAASLITIRAYGQWNRRPALAVKAHNILKDMDFSLWYGPYEHRFTLGDINNPRGGGWADYYSNENRIINVVARALGDLSAGEYKLSLGALVQSPKAYNGITVDRVAWDGSYFTYTAPAMFLPEMFTSYGALTLDPATEAQIAYAANQGYAAWGLSDCFDVRDGGYIQQGAPPAATSGVVEQHPGLVTPHASVLALITSYATQAISNLQTLQQSFPAVYDANYGFRASVMVNPADSADYGAASYRFTTLDQEWLFLAIANYQTGFLWTYFMQDAGVASAYREMMGTLPRLPEPPAGCATLPGGAVICVSN